MRSQLTVGVVERMGAGTIAWDTRVRGFGIRRQGNSRTYFLKTRVAGRQFWISIGQHGSPWTVNTARAEAQRLLGEIAAGANPALAKTRARGMPSVAEFADVFLAEHVDAKLKRTTAGHYRDLLRLHILPALGRLRIDQVTEADVARAHLKLADRPYVGNRAIAVLSKMLAIAERRGLRPKHSNPTTEVERYAEKKRERYLTDAERQRLGEALARAAGDGESPFVLAAIELLLHTGARVSEILSLEWRNVDLDRALLFLDASKTEANAINLPPAAVAIFLALPKVKGNPHVIVGHRSGTHLVNLQKPWRRIRRVAGLGDVRLHDLRHEHASAMAAAGASLPVIGRQLRHRSAQTTMRYAHLVPDIVRDFNGRASETISAGLAVGKARLADPERRAEEDPGTQPTMV